MLNITHHQGNTNQKYNEISPQTCENGLSEWLKSTTQETTGICKDVEKKEPSCTVGVNANWCSQSGEQNGGFSQD